MTSINRRLNFCFREGKKAQGWWSSSDTHAKVFNTCIFTVSWISTQTEEQWITQRERRGLFISHFCTRLFWKLKCKINKSELLLSHNFRKVNAKKSIINHKWKHRRRLSSIFPAEGATCSAISRISLWIDLWLTVGQCSLNNAFSCYMLHNYITECVSAVTSLLEVNPCVFYWLMDWLKSISYHEPVPCSMIMPLIRTKNIWIYQQKYTKIQTRTLSEAQFRPQGQVEGQGM